MSDEREYISGLRAVFDHYDEKPGADGRRRGVRPLWLERVPCVGCINELRCADEQLACAAFVSFVYNGRAVEPSEPNKQLYAKMFSGDDEDEQLLAEMVRLRDEGLSWSEIGKRLGYSGTTVRTLLSAHQQPQAEAAGS